MDTSPGAEWVTMIKLSLLEVELEWHTHNYSNFKW